MPRPLILFAVALFTGTPGDVFAESTTAFLRRPVALVAQESRLLVANQRSGTISVVDTDASRVVAEHHVAASIADMAAVPGQHAVFVADAHDGQLIKVDVSGETVARTKLALLPPSTSRLTISPARRELFASATWARCITVVGFDESFEQAGRPHRISLPFAAQEMLLLNSDATLLVADAFAGQIAMIDVVERKVISVHQLKGHNIRGLAISNDGDHVLVAHQKFDPLARADYEDLHWGALVINAVRVLDTRRLVGTDEESNADGWLDHFGGIGDATGDPGGVVTGPRGLVAVALSGVGEVAIRRGGYATRLKVGRRPEAMAVSNDKLFVANRFDDSISVINLLLGKTVQTIPLGPKPKLSAIDRGELLFFDAELSHDSWISCHSCHTDGHSSGLVVDTLGDGDYGAPKRVPSLLGTGDTGPWAWNGKMKTLAGQVRKSVTDTMYGDAISDEQTADLVAYLQSLKSPPPVPVIVSSESVEPLIARGHAVFKAKGCVECHSGTTYTTEGAFDVGLIDEQNRGEFNPPSLRGVSQRDRLFHDARANGLDDVVRRVRHKLDKPLSPEDSSALVAFLRSL